MAGNSFSSGKDLPGVQMLRGLAVTLVALHHGLKESAGAADFTSPDWLTTAGESGVDVFFVISGFVVLYSSFPKGRDPIGPGKFLFRRMTRVYPLYWVSCLAIIAVAAVGLLKSKDVSASVVLKSLALFPSHETLIGGAWPLSYGIYFYLIFAATLLLRSKDASTAIAMATIVVLWAVAQAAPASELGDFLANPIAIEFCFGLLLARVFLSRSERFAWPAYLSLPGFIALATAPLFVFHADTGGLPAFSRVIFWGLPASFIVLCFLSVGPPQGSIGRFAVWVGDASYSIYLTQFFVMIGYAWLLKRTMLAQQSQVLIIPIVVVVCIALGLTTSLILERRLLAPFRVAANGRAPAADNAPSS